MENLPRGTPIRQTEKRMDLFTRFLNSPIPEGEEELYNKIRPLVSKFNCISFLQREDVPSFVKKAYVAMVMMFKGQKKTARFIMVNYNNELQLFMSVEGWFGEEILAGNKIEYTQTQNLHEFQHRPEKRGFFGGKK